MTQIKKKRDQGKKHVHVKLDEDLHRDLEELLDGKSKQRFFEQCAQRFVAETRIQHPLRFT